MGVGTDGFGNAFPPLRTPEFWEVEWGVSPTKAHGEIVQIAATQGAVGLAAALWIVVGAVVSIRRLAAGKGPATRASAAAAAASLGAWGVASSMGFSVVATGSLAAALAGWVSGASDEPGDALSRNRAIPSGRPGGAGGGALGAAISVLAAVALWIPLVLTPWRAATAASRALSHEESEPARPAGLSRAFQMAPWVDAFAAEAGRSYLIQAFASPNPAVQRRLLGWAHGAFERAARIAPDVAEHQAFLARVIAAQAARSAESPEASRAALWEAYRADSVSAVSLVLVEQGLVETGLVHDGYSVARRCATLYPDFAVPMGDLGYLALRQGRTAGAIDTLGLALRRSWRGVASAEEAARENLRRALEASGGRGGS